MAELIVRPGDYGLPPEAEVRSPEPALAPARSLREWLANPSLLVAPELLIPLLAVEKRTTLLSGREKSGKSTLTAQLVADATQGRPILGESIPAPRSVLWYAIDEPVADALRRFDGLDPDLDRVVVSDTPRTLQDLFGCLAVDLDQHPTTSVVVIDTLSRLLSGVDVNAADKVEPLLRKIVDFFRERQCASVLLFHTGKGGREYRGSTAIGANVDEILTLQRQGEDKRDDFDAEENATDDGRRVLVLNGRNLRGRVQLAYREGRYGLWDAVHPPRDRILNALQEGPAKSKTDLVTRAKVQKKIGLQLIGEMIVSGEIIETGDGLSLPGSRRSPGSEPGNRPETASGSRLPSVPPQGTAREPLPGTEPRLQEGSVPGISPLGWGKREPLDVAI